MKDIKLIEELAESCDIFERENIALKDKIKQLELMVKTYESAYENGCSEEGITEYMCIAMEIFHPERRVDGYISCFDDDIDWLDKELQDLILENHENYQPRRNS